MDKAGDVLTVAIHLHPLFYDLADGNEVIEVQGATVGVCVEALVSRYPGLRKLIYDKDGHLQTFIEIYVNRQAACPDELKRPVRDGDRIHLIVMIAGG
jgi:molybdopterin converting factor small subunit